MDSATLSTPARPRRVRDSGLNYKFQRLRERIRHAVRTGELAGKLPGERILARRFHVNAKTLSKALTDLAAEGLLERSIGRGTFVAGQAPQEPQQNRWLLLVEAEAASDPLVTELLKLNPEARLATAEEIVRPSLVSQYAVVVNCSSAASQGLYHDLAIRGVPVIETRRALHHYSTHAVLLDRHLAAFCLGRDMLLAGHTRLAAVDVAGSTTVFAGLSQAAARYGNGIVETLTPEQLHEAIDDDTTAFVCDGVELASHILCMLEGMGLRPGLHSPLTLGAMGTLGSDICCSGYYVDPARQATAIADLARTLQPHRPSMLWLTGTFVERGTLGVPRAPGRMLPQPQPMIA